VSRRRIVTRLLHISVALRPPVADQGSDEPCAKANGGKETVRNDEGATFVRELQTETAIDDTEREHYAADPSMRRAPTRALLAPLVEKMVCGADDGLKEEDGDDDDADDWVAVFGEELRVALIFWVMRITSVTVPNYLVLNISDPNAHTEGCEGDAVREDLPAAVEPCQASEVGCS
jgi:hypothetical protein